MLRPTLPTDTTALVALADATGVFKPHEIVALREVLDDYHAANRECGHVARTYDEGGPLGFVYYAPTAMTDRTWELWWIAVGKALQGRGIGGVMLAAVEADVRAAGGRLLLIETSSTSAYEPTRQFYLKHEYSVAARIPDFYADGDDKIIFAKRLGGPKAHP
jgi:ribosomal protein S18 acetylase RimI-like enzyme